jgi:hypothetical protein
LRPQLRVYVCGWHSNPHLSRETILVRPTPTPHNLATTLSLRQGTAHSMILSGFLEPLLGPVHTTSKQTIALLSIQPLQNYPLCRKCPATSSLQFEDHFSIIGVAFRVIGPSLSASNGSPCPAVELRAIRVLGQGSPTSSQRHDALWEAPFA